MKDDIEKDLAQKIRCCRFSKNFHGVSKIIHVLNFCILHIEVHVILYFLKV